MVYRINILGNLVDEFNNTILVDCPPVLNFIFKDYENNIDKLEDKLYNKGIEIQDLENRIEELEDTVEELNNKIDINNHKDM